ncbi:MAG: hypothetical protein K6C99_03515 [Lachnospiraceae bacterium]|nr:hypothetical protein [Lachnospiraceae bacterium]
MRITNKVMQNNSLRNINNNKVQQDMFNTQLATGKKVDKPSDDPVVAIRSLRLRSDVAQIDQYYKRNIEDASSWLQLTEGSAKQTISAITGMIEKCESGASDQYTVEDKLVMIDSLIELKNEVYRTGDSDYAGRYIFTGYRTNTSLSFGNEVPENETYQITEAFDFDDLDEMTYVDTGKLSDITSSNYSTYGSGTTDEVTEQSIESMQYYRFRVGYDNLDGTAITLSAVDGDPLPAGIPTTAAVAADRDAAYNAAASGTGVFQLIKETGEVVMSRDVYDAINNAKNADGTHRKLSVTYEKSEFRNTDLRPEHYYYCNRFPQGSDSTDPGNIEFNADYKNSGAWDQPIEYQIGFNQKIQVNSYAADIFSTSIGRDVSEVTDIADRLKDVISQVDMLKGLAGDKTKSDAELADINAELDAAKKAKTYLSDQLQKTFSKYITRMQGYLDIADEALTQMGNRGAQLDLVKNRLSDQQTTFKELQSNNEDADATEVAVQLSSAQVSYEAALMATGKMIQTTLLNYL